MSYPIPSLLWGRMEFHGSVIKPLEQEAGKFRMFLEAEKFAEELCQFHKSLGASDDLAKWLADGWLSSFHGMYERRTAITRTGSSISTARGQFCNGTFRSRTSWPIFRRPIR